MKLLSKKRVADGALLSHDALMDHETHRRVAAAIEHMAHHVTRQPSLQELADVAGLSPAYFSRQFKAHAGLSPKRFLEQLTVERLKQRLISGSDLLQAQLDAGLSGAGRVHDHFVTLEAVTPGQFGKQGQGVVIRYGFHPGKLGEMLIATTQRGLCFLALIGLQPRTYALDELRASWPNACLVEDQKAGREVAQSLMNAPDSAPLPLHLRGTNFQVQVWRALLRIPPGRLATYTELAKACQRPTSIRAVANAVGANPLALVIPCHRVIRKSGALGGYRWTVSTKAALIADEGRIQAPRPDSDGVRQPRTDLDYCSCASSERCCR